MNKIERQKSQLIAISTIIIIVSAIVMLVGIAMVVLGAIGESSIGHKVRMVLFGSVFTLIGMAGIAFGIVYLVTGRSLSATKGSIADGNLGHGTVNMTKCAKCGNKINPEDKFCGHCGASIENKLVCPECGATNMSGNTNCTSCGAKL